MNKRSPATSRASSSWLARAGVARAQRVDVAVEARVAGTSVRSYASSVLPTFE
jgi:hypothetical protein